MSDWIHVSLEKLTEKASNAQTVSEWWAGVKVPRGGLGECWGKSNTQLIECAAAADDIHHAMNALLTNTVAWCKSVHMNFETTDQN